jgi:glycosyltransferase involved in cell wall biosynthesis
VAVTNETKKSLQKLGVGSKIRWKVIHIGVPELPIKKQISSTTPLKLLWVGRFTEIKDPNYALEVMRSLIGKDVELTMVGGGELFHKTKIDAVGLPIKFTDWMKDPFSEITDFDLLMITSRNEGLPLVMLEAANNGRATIARNVGGLSEFIENNKTGLLVDGGPDLMAKKISEHIQSKEDLIKFGVNANSILHDEFSLKKMAGEYLEFYKDLGIRK